MLGGSVGGKIFVCQNGKNFVFFGKAYTRGKSAFPKNVKAAGKTICESLARA